MNIELRNLSEIKPYEKNPRVNDQAVHAVAESIRQFGFRQPIVVDSDGVIVVGHTRWKAAVKLGLERVPVHVAHELTPEQAKAYRIADNATADLATWDLELLPGELAELQQLDVDLSLLGFPEDELAMLLDPGVKAGLCDPDEVPGPASKSASTPTASAIRTPPSSAPKAWTSPSSPASSATPASPPPPATWTTSRQHPS